MWIKAFLYAAKKHKGQKDKAGKPYILHPLYVSLHCKGRKARIAALLHDVIEDTDAMAADLLEMGFGRDVTAAVQLLSKPEDEDYFDYVRRVKKDPIAAEVKKNDLRHNMQLKRLKTISKKDLERRKKYQKALRVLTEE